MEVFEIEAKQQLLFDVDTSKPICHDPPLEGEPYMIVELDADGVIKFTYVE